MVLQCLLNARATKKTPQTINVEGTLYLSEYMSLFFHICQNEKEESFIENDLMVVQFIGKASECEKKLFYAFPLWQKPSSIWYSKIKPNVE